MDIKGYELIEMGKDNYSLIVYLDPQMTEFAAELDGASKKKKDLQLQINELVRSRFPAKKISVVKVMVGSLMVATLYMGAAPAIASAQTNTIQTQKVTESDVYVVQSGDSLSVIAKRFDISVSSLKTVNNLTSDNIYIGQRLSLPFITYTIVSGDSLSVIAKRNNTTTDSIRAYNQLTSDTIYVGQKLKIPIAAAPTVPASEQRPSEESNTTYKVNSGDSLSVIAKRLNTTVETIRSLNNLTTDMIYVGQALKIPGNQQTEPVQKSEPEIPSTPTETTNDTLSYVIVSGDSLSVIANRFNTAVDQIRSLNNLTTDMIYVGQVLNIPQKKSERVQEPSTETSTYTVVRGDSLSLIAKTHMTTVNAIKSSNNLTTNMIYVGQVLTIPKRETIIQPPADQTAPPVPVLEQQDRITNANQSEFVVKGRTEAGATVTISITDGVSPALTYNLKADADGSFLQHVDLTALRDGTVTITTSATDAAGNKSGDGQLMLKKDTQTQEPAIEHSKIINQQAAPAFLITGTVETAATVSIVTSDNEGVNIEKEVLANEHGEFSAFINTTTLNDGEISITIKAMDSAGNESEQVNTTAIKDTTIMQPELAELTTISSSNASSYTITGITESDANVIIRATDSVNGSIISETKSSASGKFGKPVNMTALNDGPITVTVTAIDKSGNESSKTQARVVKDTVVGEPIIDHREQITLENVNRYTIFGLSEPGDEVEIIIADGLNPSLTAETSTNENGEFQANFDLRQLQDGKLTVTTRATDNAGNRSAASQTTIVKETSLEAPVIKNTDSINYRNQKSYRVVGNAHPDSTVDIIVSDGIEQDVLATTTANDVGEFNLEIDLGSLHNTYVTIRATQTSPSGIVSDQGEVQLLKDAIVPVAPTLGNNNFINKDNEAEYRLIGEAEPDSEVNVKIANVDGEPIIVNDKADASGSYQFSVDLTSLHDGDVRFEVTQADEAGNVSPSMTKTLVKDTVAPTKIALISTPNIYKGNQDNYTLTGKSEPNIKIEVLLTDGEKEIRESVTSNNQGVFEYTTDTSFFRDGEINLSFVATDAAGNEAAPQSKQVVKDTSAPTEAILKVSDYMNSSNVQDYSILGTDVEEGAQVRITVNDGNTQITKNSQVTSRTFERSFDLTPLEDGLITIEVEQTDRFGNKSIVQTSTVEKDTIVENPVVTKNGFRVENGNTIYTAIGVAEANATVKVAVENGPVISEIAEANGFFSIDVNIDEFATPEELAITIIQTDQAGNESETLAVQLNIYTVTSGDTLYTIAKRYNTTVDAIMSLNNLSSEELEINQTLRLPAMASEVINLGYLYFGNTNEYVNTVKQTNLSMNVVSPSYFDINPDGTLKLTYQVDLQFVEEMHQQGLRVVPFLSNHWNRDVGRAMLANKELAAQQIADAIERFNLDGVNVDIENITDEDRDDFTAFVRLLRQKVPSTKDVSVAVAANPNGWTQGWHGAYDYTNLGKYADYLMIMSYDESFPGGEAGPVASYGWVERSIQYAIDQQVALDKIVVGVAHYGRYWMEGSGYGGYGISNAQVEKLITTYNGTVVFDEISKTPKATITIDPDDPITFVAGSSLSPGTYTIWFENEQSIRQKLNLVSEYDIRGVGNWSLGQENKAVWNSYATTLPSTVPVVSPVYQEQEIQSYETYTVVSGDSLWEIADRNRTTVSNLKAINGLLSDNIYVGQKLKVPAIHEPTIPEETQEPLLTTYKVVSGDSLSKIALNYNTTLNAIKEANNLTGDMIYIGQTLTIPK
ncbi:LysM peptidoglycan-binding domain-containing protein [Radiobacillus sp. PE A8.2]|uniref:LysM peptidoglycan-binding domain-containing protein n=1 Tax=Radiobacillus sp. PE A8.2 TaxID=3380349 RepID=UPI00388E6AE2